MDPQALYVQLGRLVEGMPQLDGPFTREVQQWLGRIHALLTASGDTKDIVEFDLTVQGLAKSEIQWKRADAAQRIRTIVFRALSKAELKAPATAQGAFIPAGSAFDALAAVAKVLQAAQQDVLIVDPYLDARVLMDFAPLAPEGVLLRLLADQASVYPSLAPAVQRWIEQHGPKRPLEARLSPRRELHDRLMVIDGSEAWSLTQSFKNLAER